MEFSNIEEAVKYAIQLRKTMFENVIINFNNEKTLFNVSNTYNPTFEKNLLLTLNGEDFQFLTQSENDFFNEVVKSILEH